MGPAELAALPQLPRLGRCRCGQTARRSHLEYLGRGQSVAIHLCPGCGQAYRAAPPAREDRAQKRSRKPLPDGGHPENPVLDPDLAARIRELTRSD
ncbi:MAG: hypothetical protein M0027_05700 [Candidatus Dormibacteraeota bacterium]|jgi:hypothetical protein|nr:hypothetical protein [Candidatus Dormibacteraeota bacterium]